MSQFKHNPNPLTTRHDWAKEHIKALEAGTEKNIRQQNETNERLVQDIE